jgi:hypothetical protein
MVRTSRRHEPPPAGGPPSGNAPSGRSSRNLPDRTRVPHAAAPRRCRPSRPGRGRGRGADRQWLTVRERDEPLNLQGNTRHPFRASLSAIRWSDPGEHGAPALVALVAADTPQVRRHPSPRFARITRCIMCRSGSRSARHGSPQERAGCCGALVRFVYQTAPGCARRAEAAWRVGAARVAARATESRSCMVPRCRARAGRLG